MALTWENSNETLYVKSYLATVASDEPDDYMPSFLYSSSHCRLLVLHPGLQ